MTRLWSALICGHLLGLIALAGCLFASTFLLPNDSGVPPGMMIAISLSALVVGFATCFFRVPDQKKN